MRKKKVRRHYTAQSTSLRIIRNSRDRIFPRFFVWILAAIVLVGLLAKILHVVKHHW